MTDPEFNTAPRAAWKSLALRIGIGAEHALETVRARFDARFRPDRPLHLIPYRGHANATRATVSARALVYTSPPSDDPDSIWDELQASYRRFETDEVPGIRVQLSGVGLDHQVLTDDEGYAHFDFAPPPGSGDFTVSLSLPDADGVPTSEARLSRPGAAARFGVISDVDDTVMITEATSIVKMMRLTLLGSAASRVAFDGVAAFYRALVSGGNPLFYVSSSPWNLYEFLEDFMRLKGLPPGPMLLRDFGLDRDKFVAGPHLRHKLGAIRSILDRHATLPFVLIGDSGQHDPEVYRQIAEANPARILAIYIRDVAGDVRDVAVRAHIEALDAIGVPMLLVPDTLAATRHAATLGLIDATALEAVAADVVADRAPHEAVDAQPEIAPVADADDAPGPVRTDDAGDPVA